MARSLIWLLAASSPISNYAFMSSSSIRQINVGPLHGSEISKPDYLVSENNAESNQLKIAFVTGNDMKVRRSYAIYVD